MSDFTISFNEPGIPKESVFDEMGRICVDPATFQKLCYFDDAIKLGILAFIAGMAVMYALNYIEKRWNECPQEEE